MHANPQTQLGVVVHLVHVAQNIGAPPFLSFCLTTWYLAPYPEMKFN